MKFEYDNMNDDRECVAYIDGDGDLCMRDNHSNVLLVTLGRCGASTYETEVFDPSDATHKFYPGDKLTITF